MSEFALPGSQAQRAIQEGLFWPIDEVLNPKLIHEKPESGEKLAWERREKSVFLEF